MRLSLVVGLYNMRREIPRSLLTMSPAFQNLAAADYEIIVVDNGSADRPDVPALQALAPNLRYVYIEGASVSPTGALNQAVAEAQGELVTVVIDGARMFSPGVLSRTLQVFDLFDDPFVYAPSLHLGSQLQNDSAYGGYDQHAEDALLQTVDWQDDGYELFSISNVEAVPERVLRPTFESNCFTVRRSTWDRIGGYHSGFAESTGGGIGNWELFARYMRDQAITPVLLVGEATFHQFHGGASTNHSRAEHPIRGWMREHVDLFGVPYTWPAYEPVLFGQPRESLIEGLYDRNLHTSVALIRQLSDTGEHQAAIAVARLLVERFPNDPGKLQALAEAFDRGSQRAEALAAVDDALEIAPTEAELHVTKGVILVGLRRYRDARASFDRSLELDEYLAEGHFHRAHLARREYRHDDAVQGFEQAIALEPEPPEHYLADLALAQADRSQASTVPAGSSDHSDPVEPELVALHRSFVSSVRAHYRTRGKADRLGQQAVQGSFSLAESEALIEIVRNAEPKRVLIVGGFLGWSTRVMAHATESLSSSIVTVDPNLRHRIFTAPLDHARTFVTDPRVQFVDGFFASRRSRASRGPANNLIKAWSLVRSGLEHRAVAQIPIVDPIGEFDLVLIDAASGAELELVATAMPLLASPAMLIVAGQQPASVDRLVRFALPVDTIETVSVEGRTAFTVTKTATS